ncbi:DedA family protein, partial [Patescibacteria group bacterium]
MLEFVAELAVEILNALGYGGLFFLMAAESMILPVPSEAVMPFAGFLVARGQMSFIVAAAAALLGTIAGSLLSYWLGLLGGRAFIRRYGRFFLLEEAHLEWTERWFARYGEKTVFL